MCNESGAKLPAFFLLSVLVVEQIASNLLAAIFTHGETWYSYQVFLLLYALKDSMFAGVLSLKKSRGGFLYLSTLVSSAVLCVFCAGLINYGYNDLAYDLRYMLNLVIVTAQLLVVLDIIRQNKHGR